MKTSGEIRVHLHHRAVRDPIAAARKVFEKLGMTRTAESNGVLVFVAPRSQNFAILGDAGIHAKCGDVFLGGGRGGALGDHLRNGRFTEGIVGTVEKLRQGSRGALPSPRRTAKRAGERDRRGVAPATNEVRRENRGLREPVSGLSPGSIPVSRDAHGG